MKIDGLHWFDRVNIRNGKDSFVVPFPETKTFNIVNHGNTSFDYHLYGIHLGQVDNLTFLGDENQEIEAHFIDLRKGSKTYGVRVKEVFHPSTHRTLHIPTGVAHTLKGLENVYTINSYTFLLPGKEHNDLEQTEWTPENDIINIPLDIKDEDLPAFVPMTEEASLELYKHVSSYQERFMNPNNFSHPEEKTLELDNGKEVKFFLRENHKHDNNYDLKENLGISGLYLQNIKSVKTGEHSSVIPLAYGAPYYIVSHGSQCYNFTSYGVHLGQEDHLIFLGQKKNIHAKFVDFRKDSPTLHKKIERICYPFCFTYKRQRRLFCESSFKR